MRIVLVSGSNLLAADRNGLSDPYAVLRLGGKKRRSKTIKKTLNPTWSQEMEFTGPVASLTSLEVFVFDYDYVGRDDKLGNCKVDLSSALAQPHADVPFADVTLSTQGSISLKAMFVPSKPRVRGGDAQALGEDDQELLDATFTEATDRASGRLVVTLISASGLPAADRGGTSDPYVKLTTNRGVTHKSATVRKTLDPSWQAAEFEWTGNKTAMGMLELVVFDQDIGSRDDRLGTATVNLAAVGVFDEGAHVKTLEAPLNTRGVLRLRVAWHCDADLKVGGGGSLGASGGGDAADLEELSQELFLQEFREEERALGLSREWLRRKMPWERMRTAFTRVGVRVTVIAARGLLAADLGGTSDPYVKLTCAGKAFTTSTVPKTVNPVWEETFKIGSVMIKDVLSGPLRLEVFDNDKVSKDDSLGTAAVTTSTLSALVDEALGPDWHEHQEPEGQELWVPLATQGHVGLRIFVDASAAHESTLTWGEVLQTTSPAQYIRELPFLFRLRYSQATVRVTVRHATKVPVADSHGSSDPYAVITLAGQTVRTRTIKSTINPKWDEPFEFSGLCRDFLEKPMDIEIFDEDKFSAHDSIGYTDLATTHFKQLFDEEIVDDHGKDFTLPLTIRGDIVITVSLVAFDKATWEEAMRTATRPARQLVGVMQMLPSLAAGVRREHTEVRVGVTLHRAQDLLAADTAFLYGKGLSDPYVTIELAGETFQSSTRYKTLNPVWDDEKFDYCLEMIELESDKDGNLTLEFYDFDDFSADDALGEAFLPIPTILAQAGEGPVRHTLPLSTQGSVELTVDVPPLSPPGWGISLSRAVRPWILAFRAFFLYYRIPYDRSIWRKLRDPIYWTMLLIAASPNTYVRGAFYTLYLACILVDFEEFQVMRFILGLKGTQFISGIFKFVKLAFQFWGCSVTDPAGCALSGPGVGHSSVLHLIMTVIWLQLLLWIAFLLLPFAGKLNPLTGKINHAKGLALWDEAMVWAAEQEAERASPGAKKRVSPKQRRIMERRLARAEEAAVLAKASTYEVQVNGMPGRGGGGGGRYQPPPYKPKGGDGTAYQPLDNEVDEEMSLGSFLKEEPPPAHIVNSIAGEVEHGLGPDSPATPRHGHGLFSLDRPPSTVVHEALLGSPLGGPYAALVEWTAPYLAYARAKYAEGRRYYDALTFPERASEKFTTNRLFSLLTWDTWMFALVALMMLVMMYDQEWVRLHEADPEGVGAQAYPMRVLTTLGTLLQRMLDGTIFSDWRTQITFQLVKLLFALTAAPFFIFTLGPFGKIFAHTDPTAWTRSGRCVLPDPNGLSSYIDWLRTDVLHNSRHADELDARFPLRDIKRLNRMVVEGEEVLEKAWQRPGSAPRVTAKKKAQIDAMLASIVTREKASDALFRQCFPDKVLVHEYQLEQEILERKAKDLAANKGKKKDA